MKHNENAEWLRKTEQDWSNIREQEQIHAGLEKSQETLKEFQIGEVPDQMEPKELDKTLHSNSQLISVGWVSARPTATMEKLLEEVERSSLLGNKTNARTKERVQSNEPHIRTQLCMASSE